MDTLTSEDIERLILDGETHMVEFKKDFDWKDSDKKFKYLKAMAGLHNHEGGTILFGVSDEGEIHDVGTSFDALDNVEISKALYTYFQPSIRNWSKRTVLLQGVKVGVITVAKRQPIPVVCKKENHPYMRESDIYYRYNSETRCIKAGDLFQLMTELSKGEVVEQSRRNRLRDNEPRLEMRSSGGNSERITLSIKNVSENRAIIKKVENLDPTGLQVRWEPTQIYGHVLEKNKELPVEGTSSTISSGSAPWHFRIIFSDIDHNDYFQEIKKQSGSAPVQHTWPKLLTE